MYLDFFGFREKPFTITPNPRFLYLSRSHKEVFAHLLYGIQDHCGFIAVSGEVGTGKTTVLRTLLDELEDESCRVALIFNPCLSALELVRNINREFGVDSGADNLGELIDALNRFLLEQRAEKRTVVLIIDEAQNLDPQVLEQVRLLSNLETETDKLIQIVLVGQPELDDLLERTELRQLNQRITVRYRLEKMDFQDTCEYVAHRLRVAGLVHSVIFTPAALKRIFRFSGGLPRLINVACDRVLLAAYGQGHHEVGAALTAEALRELKSPRRSFAHRLLSTFLP